MNDLGLMLAWSAVQVSLLLIPAVVLSLFASRRSPAAGTWVASLSLGLVVAVSLLTFVPWSGASSSLPTIPEARPSQSVPLERRGDAPSDKLRVEVDASLGWSFPSIRDLWNRLETTAAVPAARCRPWAKGLAVVALAGTGLSLLHLLVGLWGVQRCVRQSRPVDDPGLNALLQELQGSLGCRRRVEFREAPELTSPATAGCWRVFLLLPDDWRSWDEPERRAVLAHELAHVCRNDYATGVVARLALALHFYHPLVHWLTARLQWEQELAADALGARFAGGRSRYLLSLSRLALRQDGRIPCWPARAFLPAKGNLIRRIIMLRDEKLSIDRPWSAPRRGASAFLLFAVAAGVLTLRGPARGDDAGKVDDGVKTVSRGSRPGEDARLEPFDLTYLPDDVQGIVAFRPAATFSRAGMKTNRAILNVLISKEWAKAAKQLGFDPAKPGLEPLRIEMFDQVVSGLKIYRVSDVKPHWRISLGEHDLVSARTTVPIDWIGLCRVFQIELTETHEGTHAYYRVKLPALGPNSCLYFPNDRTIVFASEKRLLQHLRRTTPAPLVFAQVKDWDRSLRGLLLAAFDSRDGVLRRAASEADGAEGFDVPNLFKDGGLLTFSLDDRDDIVLSGVATLGDLGASEATARALPTFLKALREAADQPVPHGVQHHESHERVKRIWLDLLTNCRVERDGPSVSFRSSGLGMIADFASSTMLLMGE